MAVQSKPTSMPIDWLDAAEGRAFFDQQAHAQLGISGDEFLRRWDAGELAAQIDTPEWPAIRRLAALIPFAR
jgi:hypothetical protein